MGHEQGLISFVIFVIFTGAAILSTVALYARQSLLVAYIVLGMIAGHFLPNLVGGETAQVTEIIKQTGDIGIIFLLFLLGLSLDPRELIKMLSEVSWLALFSSLIFALIGFGVARAFGFSMNGSVVIGASMMFSSTIVGLKLLPTKVLHHRHTGEVMISVLLLQDIIAILVLLVMEALHKESSQVLWLPVVKIIIGFPLLILVAYVVQKFVVAKLMARFSQYKEYIFLLSIGWCLAMAQAALLVGLSPEIGAFIAGVSIATGPISVFIADSLKPLRDFFLVMFFFMVGAQFDVPHLHNIIIPALVLTAIMMLIKPYTFRFLLQRSGETKHVAWEVGVRLAQVSEFSVLIAYMALKNNIIGQPASDLIQAVTILTFIVSTYWVVFCFPTPVAVSDRLRMD